MKILFVGCNGYLGKHLCYHLYSLGHTIYGADISDTTDLSSVLSSYQRVDITDINSLSKLNFNIDYIFFFSAITGTIAGFKDFKKFISVNEIGLLNLLEYLRENNYAPHVVFPSTRLVYKGVTKTKLDEEAEKEFKTIYALNKWTCEKALQQYGKYFNIPYTIFRIGVPYGNSFGSSYSYGTLGFFINSALTSKQISIYGDGSLMRTFTHVDDICVQICETVISRNIKNDTFNVIGEDFTLKEVALLIAEKFSALVVHKDWPSLDLMIESGDTIFDSSKLRKLIENIGLSKSLRSWVNSLENKI